MPSADFCPAVRSPLGSLSRVATTQNRPHGVFPAAFRAQSPDLHVPFLMNMDFAEQGWLVQRWRLILRIPAKPITHSELMAITVPSDADRRRSEATLGCSYHAGVIDIRQSFCG